MDEFGNPQFTKGVVGYMEGGQELGYKANMLPKQLNKGPINLVEITSCYDNTL